MFFANIYFIILQLCWHILHATSE